MFENMKNFFKKFGKNRKENSKTTAKERLHLVLAQDRANISADFLEMMKQEIIEVIKKYIDIDEEAIDVKMTNKPGEDGTVGAPALYANIPIITIKNDARKLEGTEKSKDEKAKEVNEEVLKEEEQQENAEVIEQENQEENIKENQKDNIKENIEENIEEDVSNIVTNAEENKHEDEKKGEENEKKNS